MHAHNPTKQRFDAEIGNTLIQIAPALNGAGALRAALVDLAYTLQTLPASKKALLFLTATRMSAERLAQEWMLATKTFRPEIIRRVGMIFLEGRILQGVPAEPNAAVKEWAQRHIPATDKPLAHHLPRAQYDAEILKVLVHQWLLAQGPMTADRLGEIVGCSYPTVAASLKRLAPVLQRHRDRRFELDRFPQEEWTDLVSHSARSRLTLRFADRSGSPRSPESLLKRLSHLRRSDIGVGGVIGAKYYFPNLDITGAPRLDLTLHLTRGRLDTGFVQRLDPGLVVTRNRTDPAAVVVHLLRRVESFFAQDEGVLRYADPVECLLDLHETRLETQAAEFFHSFVKRRENLEA